MYALRRPNSNRAESLIDGTAGEVPEAVKTNLAMITASGRRLSALVGNAIRFTETGQVEVWAAVVDPVGTADKKKQGTQLVVEVRDTGIGIAPEAQEQIFEIFQQADSSVER